MASDERSVLRAIQAMGEGFDLGVEVADVSALPPEPGKVEAYPSVSFEVSKTRREYMPPQVVAQTTKVVRLVGEVTLVGDLVFTTLSGEDAEIAEEAFASAWMVASVESGAGYPSVTLAATLSGVECAVIVYQVGDLVTENPRDTAFSGTWRLRYGIEVVYPLLAKGEDAELMDIVPTIEVDSQSGDVVLEGDLDLDASLE